jgi:hypothetical protein
MLCFLHIPFIGFSPQQQKTKKEKKHEKKWGISGKVDHIVKVDRCGS